MTDSALPALRPMKLAELLDQAIRLYRRNFLQFIGIVAIPYVPLILIGAASSALSTSSLQGFSSASSPYSIFTNANYWLGLAGTFVVAILHLFLIQGLATAALTRAIADSYVGQPIGILSSYRRLGASAGRLVGALLWLGLIGLVLFIWLLIPCVGWISGPGLFVFLVWVVLPLVAPIVVLENHGAMASVRRAWDLSRTRFWWLIGFAFILYLFATLVVSGPTLLISSALRYFTISNSNPLTQQLVVTTVIQTLVNMITGLLYLPLQLSAITVVYFDLRVRSEGLDLALQAQPVAEAAPGQVLAAVPAGSPARLITGTDIGNFVLFTLGFLAVYALLVGIVMGLSLALVPLLIPR
jgi:hypothetical protein